MKVLLVTPTFFPIVGGSEVLTQNLSFQLNNLGIHTDIMTYYMNERGFPVWKATVAKNGFSNVFKIPAFNFSPSILNFPYALFRMKFLPNPSFIKKLKDYTIIHFIGEADLGFPILSIFTKAPKIMHCVGLYERGGVYWYYMFKRPYLRNIFKRVFLNLANEYAVLSPGQMELICELGVPDNKVTILPHCIDVNTFKPDEKKRMDNTVLFVGRIDEIKGVHILIKALNYLKIPIQLFIIGPRRNGNYKSFVEQMSHAINKRGVHRVKFLGTLNQGDLVLWYQKATLVATPFLYETYSTVTLEALACGTPVISTGEHISERGSDGILIAPRDPEKIAKAIEKLLGDKKLRDKYGRCGRKLVEQQFSCRSVTTKLVRLYNKMINR